MFKHNPFLYNNSFDIYHPVALKRAMFGWTMTTLGWIATNWLPISLGLSPLGISSGFLALAVLTRHRRSQQYSPPVPEPSSEHREAVAEDDLAAILAAIAARQRPRQKPSGAGARRRPGASARRASRTTLDRR